MANTQMERCPQCGSDKKDVFILGCLPRDPWHSTPAAPETARQKIREAMKSAPQVEWPDDIDTDTCESETLRKEEA